MKKPVGPVGATELGFVHWSACGGQWPILLGWGMGLWAEEAEVSLRWRQVGLCWPPAELWFVGTQGHSSNAPS